jgi:hypothetical protein
MKAIRTWQGVRMRRVLVGADPDAVLRQVTLPASWDDTAAAALAGLASGEEPVKLAAVADAWIRPVSERALRAGMEVPLSERLHRMLLLRHGAPSAQTWRGQEEAVPGFVLNLASFHDAASGFDAPAFAEAVETAVIALRQPSSRSACQTFQACWPGSAWSTARMRHWRLPVRSRPSCVDGPKRSPARWLAGSALSRPHRWTGPRHRSTQYCQACRTRRTPRVRPRQRGKAGATSR